MSTTDVDAHNDSTNKKQHTLANKVRSDEYLIHIIYISPISTRLDTPPLMFTHLLIFPFAVKCCLREKSGKEFFFL